MTVDKQTIEQVTRLLGQLRPALSAGDGSLPLLELAAAAVGCLADEEQLRLLSAHRDTRLPGVRLEGTDTPSSTLAIADLARKSALLLTKSLQAVADVEAAAPKLTQLQQHAAALAQRLAAGSQAATETARRQLQQLEQALGELHAVSAEYRRQKAIFDSAAHEAGGHAGQLRARLAEEQERAAALAAEEQTLRAELAQTEQELARLESFRTQHGEAQQRLAELTREQPWWQEQLATVHQELAACGEEIAQLRAQYEANQPEVERLRAERAQLQAEIDAARQPAALVEQLRAELASWEEQKRSSAAELETLQQRQVAAQSEAAQLREQLAATRQLVEAAGQFAEPQTAERIRQIWQELPVDAIDERLQEMLRR